MYSLKLLIVSEHPIYLSTGQLVELSCEFHIEYQNIVNAYFWSGMTKQPPRTDSIVEKLRRRQVELCISASDRFFSLKKGWYLLFKSPSFVNRQSFLTSFLRRFPWGKEHKFCEDYVINIGDWCCFKVSEAKLKLKENIILSQKVGWSWQEFKVSQECI